MAKAFSAAEWDAIEAELDGDERAYGLPEGGREGSLVLASFNIRKLSSPKGRTRELRFMAKFCARCDLVAVQEVMDNLDGLRRLKEEMEKQVAGTDEFAIVVSDVTGQVPGSKGMPERMAFIYRQRRIRRAEMASDITIDATGVLLNLAQNPDPIIAELQSPVVRKYKEEYAAYLKELEKYVANKADKTPKIPNKPNVDFKTFLTFTRTPHVTAFEAPAAHGDPPLRFIAVNTHLVFGSMTEREREFEKLLEWLIFRLEAEKRLSAPNFLLLGDLNLNFDKPKKDRDRIEDKLKALNAIAFRRRDIRRVYFPFIDAHPITGKVIRTNARQDQTFDQIGFFRGEKEKRLPNDQWHSWKKKTKSTGPDDYDYGVFNFADLFATVVADGKKYLELDDPARTDLDDKFQHKVSDHMPIWVRLPRPGMNNLPDLSIL